MQMEPVTEGPAQLWAHTPSGSNEQPHDLGEHLVEVACLAKRFAEPFGMGDLAYVVGLFHDLGKSNPEFQKYLRAQHEGRNDSSVPHAVWGAALAYALIYKLRHDPEGWKVLALPIQGHHAGLDDAGQAATKLESFLQGTPGVLEHMQRFLKTLDVPPFSAGLPAHGFTQREFSIRMLFSTLVDADYLDTERHFDPEQAALRGHGPSLEVLWQRLEAAQREILNDSTLVNRIRKEVYEACLEAASHAPGFYRLTVPTGGGKTRSGLAFALKHALAHGLLRVVVAIPYTSIIDQTAQVYREILGDEGVLEHHSALEVSKSTSDQEGEKTIRQRLATENWDSPLIVTTTVQLFESLFSNHPSKVRKLHRLARSVIVLDEVQTLPTDLLHPTLDVLKLLAAPADQGGYASTVVFCTATQPAYEDNRWIPTLRGVSVTEIVPHYAQHFAHLKRVEYVRCLGAVEWTALAREIEGLSQVLVVLNTRKNALILLETLGNDPDAYHLSTLLCGAHRRKVLQEVKRRLTAGEPVKLISTQVVEAGVDLDFPVVYRAIGPLDRIVQAAGRCNREGKCKMGLVTVFEPAEGQAPAGPYKVGLERARFLLQENPAERLNDPEFYRDYFRRLFSDVELDRKRIQSYREELNYPEVAKRYKLIEGETVSVVVPYENAFECLERWRVHPSYQIWRGLQPYLVSLFRHEVEKKCDWLHQVTEALYAWTGRYDERTGMTEGYRDPADLLV